MVPTWRPAAWLTTTCAFSTLAMQRSYSAEKSVVETAGGGLEQAGYPTLTHVGETREVEGEEKGLAAGTQAAWLE